MSQEVNALRLIRGDGTPLVLESNADQWENDEVELFAIMDWIDGQPLSEYVGGRPFALDEATRVTLSLAATLAGCHRAGIVHRDIKPDNVIMSSVTRNPVLVDFGMSWSATNEGALLDTDVGQELGNRFLRLPEFAPGSQLRDPRSDVTFVVGVFFFLLTARSPRQLLDANGRPPHESAAVTFSRELTDDPRWRHVVRIFRVGFQPDIAMRFQSIDELRVALFAIDSDPPGRIDLADALNRFGETMRQDPETRRENQKREILQLQQDAFDTISGTSGEIVGGGGEAPHVVHDGPLTTEFLYNLHRPRMGPPYVPFRHRITLIGTRVTAEYRIDEDDWTPHYHGPTADRQSFQEAMATLVKYHFAEAVERLHLKVKDHFAALAAND